MRGEAVGPDGPGTATGMGRFTERVLGQIGIAVPVGDGAAARPAGAGA